MEGVGTSTAGFIGLTERGAVRGTPEFVSSFADYRRKFGGYLPESTHGANRFLTYAVEQFFQNGGTRCYVMRVAPEDAKVASAARASLSVSAKSPGKWGDAICVLAQRSSKAKTQVMASSGDAMGAASYTFKNASSFAPGDTVAIVENGTVTEYNRIVRIQGAQVTFETSVDIDLVDTGLLPRTTVESCEVDLEISWGEEVERYETVSLNPQSTDYIESRLARSNLVRVQCSSVDEIMPPMLVLAGSADSSRAVFNLSGGSDGSCREVADKVYIGEDTAPGKRTGLEAFREVTNVSIMAIPGVTAPAVQLALVAHCQTLQSRFAVLDMSVQSAKPQELLEHRSIVDSDYAAMYHPWLQMYDPMLGRPAFVPPSGAVCGIYARSDATRGVHKAPANEVVNHCMGLSCLYNKAEQDLLNPAGVNLIRALPGQGIRVWGGRTCSQNPLWKYINVRRLFIYLEESIKAQTNWAVFEPNDQVLWFRVQRTIASFLRDMYRAGALVGSTEDEAFFVNIGPDTMTPSDIQNGRLICVIGVAPSRPAEFVIFRITQNLENASAAAE